MLPLPGDIAARIAFALKMAVVCSRSRLAFVVNVTVSQKTMPASRPIPRKPAFLRWLLAGSADPSKNGGRRPYGQARSVVSDREALVIRRHLDFNQAVAWGQDLQLVNGSVN